MKAMSLAVAAAAAILVFSGPVQVKDGAVSAGVAVAEAQQMGHNGWRAPQRSRGTAAQYQYLKRANSNSNSNSNPGAGIGGNSTIGSLHQETHNYTTDARAIGNLNEITQILSGDAKGTIGQNTQQDSQGNQGANANSELALNGSQTGNTAPVPQVQQSASESTGDGEWQGFSGAGDDADTPQ